MGTDDVGTDDAVSDPGQPPTTAIGLATKHRRRRRLRLNSSRLLAARVISQALAVLFTLAVARSLGEAGFGRFAFVSTVVFIGNVITTFGLDTLLIRDVGASRAASRAAGKSASQEASSTTIQSTINAVLLIQLTLSALFIGVIWLAAPRLPNQTGATAIALRLASLSLLPLAFSTVDSAILRAYEKMGSFLWFSIISAGVMALGGLLLCLRGGTIVGAALIILIGQSAGALAAFILSRLALPEFRRRWFRPSRAAVAYAWRVGAALAALMILSVLYQRLGILLLSTLDTDVATGIYSAAARVLEALKMIPGAFFGALLPLMAAIPQSSERRGYSRSYAMLFVLSMMLAGLTAALARPIILILYGPSFEAAVTPLRIMSLSLPLTVLAFKLSFDLVLRRLERVATLAILITLVFAAVSTAWLIGRWSVNGAAVALVLSETMLVIILAVLSAKVGREVAPGNSSTPIERQDTENTEGIHGDSRRT